MPVDDTLFHWIARLFLRIVVEFFFELICGHVGHFVVRLVTFGRVDLDPTEGGESILASAIGLGVLVAISFAIGFALRP
jgi:hypothetical protein